MGGRSRGFCFGSRGFCFDLSKKPKPTYISINSPFLFQRWCQQQRKFHRKHHHSGYHGSLPLALGSMFV
ncbi:hypothetical protein CCACVL1_01306 [Corchorus capsularis]|uniref:Uncharacterized protein n=1 Tax=Corchorus capsularis TaxID=210143 RepID=A0A1R3KK33_COCAP|nr:hypothetical protein CCACVL1_01306 [Corchorus capsularis]